jgi:NADH:ubiquinone oxidoreductase subunit 6 (subunit J)
MSGWEVFVIVGAVVAVVLFAVGSLVRRKTERITQDFIDETFRANWCRAWARRRKNRR